VQIGQPDRQLGQYVGLRVSAHVIRSDRCHRRWAWALILWSG
jgi:hypothetical protein